MNRIRFMDWLSRRRAWPYYCHYTETQWYSRRELDELRLEKLKRLLTHCEQYVPFYRAVMREQGIVPARVDSLDVLQRFPVIDKATVRGDWREFLASGAPGLGTVRYSQTGGTTGEPLRVPKDVAVRSSTQAAMFRFHDWMGVGVGDPKLVVWGRPIVTPNWQTRARNELFRRITNTREVDAFGIDRAVVPALAAVLRSFGPILLHGYCQSIYELARWFTDAGEQFELRAVSTTVEPLFSEYRPLLREVFGCSAFDQYGSGEVEAIAMECAMHEGLHVTEERVILELDENQNVILTDLDNLAFPFVRYRNGDQAVPASRPCRCGRVSLLLDRILGRIGDIIGGPSGKRVHPEFFTHLLNETGISYRRRLRKYQVVQEQPDRLVWKVAADPLSADDRSQLISKVRAYLGTLDIVIESVNDIPPGRSGKFQYVIAHGGAPDNPRST
jgi:phenylacetate-CoA ligase